MNAALMYCTNEFQKALGQTQRTKTIHDAFEVLAEEIKKLDYITQINMYSVTTQFLESLLKKETDVINPLDVFMLRLNAIIDEKNSTTKKVVLALGVIAIALSVVILGGAIGFGVGMLLGLWQTPLMFMASLLSAELAPLVTAAASALAGAVSGLASRFLFFREPGVKKAFNHCVDVIKQSHLAALPLSVNEDSMTDNVNENSNVSNEPEPFAWCATKNEKQHPILIIY